MTTFIAVEALYSTNCALLIFGVWCIAASVALPWIAVVSFVSSATGIPLVCWFPGLFPLLIAFTPPLLALELKRRSLLSIASG